ncbi:CYTH domain-containing protein [Alloyangia pacifica]|uniref:CYTH domain-containing protein n=1 Tax=Alloyangia pacifica TaxID=311180 RepID=UPI001CD57CA1|nr:CYTH domain-containing protein [Alloyangia pacifica]MCA0996673.1 CYTH domain-containing protein [Alloyangia pacifica]
MAKEIERKFLVASGDWRRVATHKVEIRDGLLAFRDGRKVRVRFYDDRATLSVKGPKSGLTRDEFEYEIPHGDGLTLLEQHCDGEVLRKTRHFVPEGADVWTVDEYHGVHEGLVVAELELATEETPFERPGWLGAEVTGKSRYRQSSLFKEHRRVMKRTG